MTDHIPTYLVSKTEIDYIEHEIGWVTWKILSYTNAKIHGTILSTSIPRQKSDMYLHDIVVTIHRRYLYYIQTHAHLCMAI